MFLFSSRPPIFEEGREPSILQRIDNKPVTRNAMPVPSILGNTQPELRHSHVTIYKIACLDIANKIGPCFHFSSQCAICLRIGDFQRMTKDNVSVSPDGIPYENKDVLLYKVDENPCVFV